MNNIQILKDSISTSMNMKLFSSIEQATHSHIFNSKLEKFLLIKCNNELLNFNPERMQKTAVKAYPLDNRPRGDMDIKSVKFYQKQLQMKKEIEPIWIIKKNNNYILLDGVHRIVASYIENKKYIFANIIY
jgi:hypothetical protein